MIFFVFLGVITLVGIIYLAISKNSNFKVRITALSALALMIIAVIVCIFLVFGVETATATPVLPDAPPVEVHPQSGGNIAALIMFVVFLIALFMVVLLIALREHRKNEDNY